eukprot:gb/GEZJ01002601.1/.p1 GENE.gb/GEZJ01002601.1/~~gb/GEZJ01002601.1/.p1  ORF type:complete len:461 (-),score=28.15 gb/GEZJ01002601.1/:965-2347(-)
MASPHFLSATFFLLFFSLTHVAPAHQIVSRLLVDPTLPTTVSRQGLTGELCRTGTQCRGARKCLSFQGGNFEPCLSSDLQCYCIAIIECTGSDECPSGEGCAENGLCFSQSLLDSSPSGGKLNFEKCSRSSECAGSRECLFWNNGQSFSCNGNNGCFCVNNAIRCETSNDCGAGESCRGVGTSFMCIASTKPGFQVNYEICRSVEDCKQPRNCVLNKDHSETCALGEVCLCLNSNPQCSSNDMCDELETCTQVETTSVCLGDSVTLTPINAAVENSPSQEEENSSQTPSTSAPSSSSTSGSVFGRPCDESSDCRGGEQCRPNENGVRLCERIEQGEEKEQVQNINEPGPSVCISVHHLSHLHENDMMYSTHRQARVLCDARNSCATAGHIVVFEEVPMMMSSYCSVVGCTKKIMKVNSPRYERARKVRSNSENLMFTSFAARYNSKMEEKVLRMAIKLGL